MRRILHTLLLGLATVALLGLVTPAPSSSQSGGLVLVLNARNPTRSLTADKAKQIYLGQTAFWHGTVPIKVYTRPGSSEAGKQFYEKILGMNAGRFSKHWTSRQLAGKGVAPQDISQASDLADKVRKAPGSVGFMLSSESEAVGSSGLKFIPLQ